MTDIFISYAREDAGVIERLAGALQEAGYSSWWDKKLTSGARYLKETEAELTAAKAVLVVWSRASVGSHWVADEAAVGRDENRLAAVTFDGSIPPLGFRQFQVTDLSHWKASAEEPMFQSLLAGLSKLVRPSSDTHAAAIEKPARSVGLRSPVVLGAMGLAVVAVIAIVAFALAMRPQTKPSSATPTSQRVAFFGFTAAGDDATAREMARTATDETFATLNAMSLETVARGSTDGVALADQIARAQALGARYALGGEVRKEGDTFAITIRLDDAPLGAALWQKALPAGTAAQERSLPVLAAADATGTTQCFISNRQKLKADTDQILSLLRRGCADLSSLTAERIGAFRDIARLTPESGYAQAAYAEYQLEGLALYPSAERSTRLAEARQALDRALTLDPSEPAAVLPKFSLGIIDRRPLAELEALFRSALEKDPNEYLFLCAYRDFLIWVGRHNEALPYAERALERNPLDYSSQLALAFLQLELGHARAAYALFERTSERFPFENVWMYWVTAASLWPGGDAAHALKLRPVAVSDDVYACAREFVAAVTSKDSAIRRKEAAKLPACLNATQVPVSGALAALGDIDSAYRAIKSIDRTTPLDYSLNMGLLFYLPARPMRFDERFKKFTIEGDLWQYWIDTKTKPDFCNTAAERDTVFCADLGAAQAGK